MAMVFYENWGMFSDMVDAAYKGYSALPIPVPGNTSSDFKYNVGATETPTLNTTVSKNGVGRSLNTGLDVVTVVPGDALNSDDSVRVNRGKGLILPHAPQATGDEFIFSGWFRVSNFAASSALLSLGNASKVSLVMRLHTDGHLYFYSANGANRDDVYVTDGYTLAETNRVMNFVDSTINYTDLGDTSGLPYAPLVANRWHFFEIKFRLGATDGLLEVRIDGAPAFSSDNINTNGGGAVPFTNRMVIGNYLWTTNYGDGATSPNYGTSSPFFGGTAVHTYWDSLFITDTTGDALNDYTGPATLYSLAPNATQANGLGGDNAFTAEGAASAHEAIDTMDGESSFINGTPAASILMNYEELPSEIDEETIRAVILASFAKSSGPGQKELQHTIAGEAAGDPKIIDPFFSIQQDFMPTNPATGNPWTIAEVNNLAAQTRVELST